MNSNISDLHDEINANTSKTQQVIGMANNLCRDLSHDEFASKMDKYTVKQHLSSFHMNIRSLNANEAQLITMLKATNYDFHVVCVS